MPYPKDQKKLEKWEKAIAASYAANPDPWNMYDTDIRVTLATYTRHLTGVAGFVPPEWLKIKAMIWVETGAERVEWRTAPMQIGNAGDPGLTVLLTDPHGKMILPPEYAATLTLSNAQSSGTLNIEAGVGYLLQRTAIFGLARDLPAARSTAAADTRSPERTVSTPKRPKLPKQHLAIVGWRTVTYDLLASYNGGGDGNYVDKLAYAYSLMTQPQAKEKK